MRALFALVIIMAVFVFMMPFVLGLAAAVIVFSLVLTLTARYLPGARKTYRSRGVYFDVSSGNKKRSAGSHPEEDEKGWYQDIQEDDTISLPEDCLKKRP
ncbi:hypothetical protein FACS1894167_12460 [Synergistales bacterium]|nr:hypothetical protein FACS1894167_12460 [Synergistales bacterium]GHV52558.1 hypothetical protein FACS1894216_08910 [Synergistales bacterium]